MAVIAVFFAISDMANAQIDWLATSGFYEQGINWSGGVAPNGSQTASFDNSGTYTVAWGPLTASTRPSVGRMHFHNGTYTLLSIDSNQDLLTINDLGGGNEYGFWVNGTAEVGVHNLHLYNHGRLQIDGNGTLNLLGDGTEDSTILTVDSRSTVVNGRLTVLNGATLSQIGGQGGTVNDIGDGGQGGTAIVSGSGSSWNMNTWLRIGNNAKGELRIEDGGNVNTGQIIVGFGLNSQNSQITVSGTDSQLVANGDIQLGRSRDAFMRIESGGFVQNLEARIADSGRTGSEVVVNGNGSHWSNTSLIIGSSFKGSLRIENGGLVSSETSSIGFDENTHGQGSITTVTGSGSQWNNTNQLKIGDEGQGILRIENGGQVNNGDGFIGFESTSTGSSVTVTGLGSNWHNSGNLSIGRQGQGELFIENGGMVSNENAKIGSSLYDNSVLVSGDSTFWQNRGNLDVGSAGGKGVLTIENGGFVSNRWGRIGTTIESDGEAIVDGEDSRWINSQNLIVGGSGNNAVLEIKNGGRVENVDGLVSGFASVTVRGNQSQWLNSGDLNIQFRGTGTPVLNIEQDGLVSIGGRTGIESGSIVNLNGGRLEFGTTTYDEFAMINGVAGSLAGMIHHNGYTSVADLTAFQNSNVDMTDVKIDNSGVLYGNASWGVALLNRSSGEIETSFGERMRFAGSNNLNSGEINNFEGQIRFEQNLLNDSDGLISGRGQFIANGGWDNQGVMAFSQGTADVLGDVHNRGTIAIAGASVATFYDDVLMDPDFMNVQVASDSYAVFYGSYNGGSEGGGTLQTFGDLRPGNSPGVIEFGGDLEFFDATSLFIEIGGTNVGQFDKLVINGDWRIDGFLDVSLIDGFRLQADQEFLFADINGIREGYFEGLSEGSWVGNYDGRDLYITYTAGDGNDLAFFTVPEPGTTLLVAVMTIGILMNRRRSNTSKPIR